MVRHRLISASRLSPPSTLCLPSGVGITHPRPVLPTIRMALHARAAPLRRIDGNPVQDLSGELKLTSRCPRKRGNSKVESCRSVRAFCVCACP
jgi:hypothetical protein